MNYSHEIVNWSDFQHYKDRNPPWIKLHYELLSSQTWVMASDKSRALMVACMLIASRHDGRIPENTSYLRRLAYLHKDPDFTELVSLGFLRVLHELQADASKMLADASVSVSVSSSESVSEKKRKNGFSSDAKTVLDHLNEITGRTFSNSREIEACIKREGCSVKDCMAMLDHKWKEWSGTEMARHINPTTPFRKSHFQAYLDEAQAGSPKRKSNSYLDRFGGNNGSN